MIDVIIKNNIKAKISLFGLLVLILSTSAFASITMNGVSIGQDNDVTYGFEGDSDFRFNNLTVYPANITGSTDSIAATSEVPVFLSVSDFNTSNDKVMRFSPRTETDNLDLEISDVSGTYSINQSFASGTETLDTISALNGRIDFEPQDVIAPADYTILSESFEDDAQIFVSDTTPHSTNIDPESPEIEFLVSSTSITGDILWEIELGSQNPSGSAQIGEPQTVFLNDLEEDENYEYNIILGEGSDSITETFEFTTIGIELSWSYEENDANGFRVYSNSTGSLEQVKDIDYDGTEDYSIKIFEEDYSFGDTISFAVTSYNEAGESTQTTDTITIHD